MLIIEDDDQLRDMLAKVLSAYGLDVVCCGDGDSAFELLAGVRFDVIVADHTLPGRTGVEIVRDVRRDDPRTVIIGVSGEDVAEPFLSAGANDFLMKPFDLHRLAMMIDGGDIPS